MPEPTRAALHTVLVIDDDELWQRVLARELDHSGYTVTGALSCADGLSLAIRDCPDVIVLDLALPDRHGLSALPAFRQACPAASVVICTGYGSIAASVTALRQGVVDFLVKPITHVEVLAAIVGALAPFELAWPAPAPMTLARVEWEHIQRVLMESGWNVSEAARRLGIFRQSLQRKLRQHPGVEHPTRRWTSRKSEPSGPRFG